MEKTPSRLCEACRHAKAEIIRESRDVRWPYRLCPACAHRFVTLSLRPLEWFHLVVLHGSHEHYLHDDFYSEEGEALQPKERVIEPEQWPLPVLSQKNLALLIDYAIARFDFDEPELLLEEIKHHDAALLQAEIQRRLRMLPAREVEGRLYMICASTLGRQAERLIRDAWQTFHPETFWALSFASASCLPLDEGFERVVQELAILPPQEVRSACQVLRYFHTEKTLDWLEIHIQPPITHDWGNLAATSCFTWERAVKWLDMGRPLSLVALDALASCFSYEIAHPTSPRQFLGSLPQEIMRLQLAAYLSRDSAPRVKQTIRKLLQCLEQGV